MKLPLGTPRMKQVDALLQLFDTDSMIRHRDESGSVPLHHACRKGAPFEILRLLLHLDEVADGTAGQIARTPHCRNHQGALPIHCLLTSKPLVGAVKFLLEAHPGSPSVRTANGDYPLMVACESSASVDVIFELLKAYPDLVR